MTYDNGQDTRSMRGFSFIEILVVMGIIAVLAGLSTVVLQIWAKRKPEMATQTRLTQLAATIGVFQRKFERFPPSDMTRIQRTAGGPKGIKKVPNGYNEGIEALFQALNWPTFAGSGVFNENDVSNTDEDELEDAPTTWGTQLWEVVDGWGNPIIYFLHTDYSKAAESPPAYLKADGDEVFPTPWKYDLEGATGFAQPNGFQVFSMGEDGIPNTEDDLKSW